MAVAVNQTILDTITWAEADFSWNSAQAERTWANTVISTWSLDADGSITMHEGTSRHAGRLSSENLLLSDLVHRTLGKNPKTTLQIGETLGKHVANQLEDGFSLVSASSRQIGKNVLRDLSFTDLVQKLAGLSHSELITLHTKIGYSTPEINFWSMDTGDVEIEIKRALTVADEVARAAGKNLSELLTVLDATKFDVEKSIAELLDLNDCYQDYINFLLSVQESLKIAEKGTRTPEKVSKEVLHIDRLYIYLRAIDLFENIAIQELLAKSVATSINESLTLIEASGRHSHRPVGEAIKITEKHHRDIALNVNRLLTINEEFARTFVIIREFADNLVLAETLAKAAEVSVEETLAILDEFLRRANAVLSDLLIVEDGDLSDEEFLDLMLEAAPPGFDKFRPFLVGDYEYQNALFREVMRAMSGDRPRLSQLEVQVDVPDVHDRGEAEIIGGSKRVYFNRTFLTAPEVTVRIKEATDNARYRITEITNEYFEIEITDDTTPVDAVIGWMAIGY